MILGIVAGGGLLALVAVAAAVYFLVIKPRQQGPGPSPSPQIAESRPPSTATPDTTLAPTDDTLPPATQPTDAPPTAAPTTSPTAVPTTTPRQVADIDRTPPVTNPPVSLPPPSTGGWAALDRQPAGVDLEGGTTGGDVADAYRSPHGQRSSGGRTLQRRPKIPADVAGPERRAAINLLHMIRFQEAYKRSNGRYGTFRDTLPPGLASSELLVKNANYKFELSVEPDGFKIVATPIAVGPRPLQGDDSGFVTWADE